MTSANKRLTPVVFLYPEPRRSVVLAVVLLVSRAQEISSPCCCFLVSRAQKISSSCCCFLVSRAQEISSSCCCFACIQSLGDHQQFLLLFFLYPEPRRSVVLAVVFLVPRAQEISSSCCYIGYTQKQEELFFMLLFWCYPVPRRVSFKGL